ncbi:MAG: hypothetical protein H0X63_06195, partial [Flavobacteriales bacterium]|nr:hypothetical protein [Flavobacteriales bacterium]
INHTKNIEAAVSHEYRYYETEAVWFPSKTTAELRLLNKLESVTLFGGLIPPGKMRYNAKDNSTTSFTLIALYHEIQLNNIDSIDNEHASIEALEEENVSRTSEFWNPYRERPFTSDEVAIETNADIVVRTNNLEKRIERIADFGKGFYKIGFFDLDLKFLIKYNDYEGIRSGLGGVTNEDLSEHFTIGGYIVRGFKDKEFKYQLATNFLLLKETNTILGLAYTSDVTEMGTNNYLNSRRTFSLFEPRLVNITQFFKHETYQTNLQHQINPKISTELQLSSSDIEQTIPYTFINDGIAFTDYTLSEAKAGILWTPFGKYIETPLGIKEYQIGFPRISTQITQSFKDVFNSDFNFTKIDLKIDHQIEHINQSFTEIVFEGNVGFGDIPLTHTYHAYPNSPNKEGIFNRFSVAGTRSFETMYFGEFFSDKIASVQIKHQLKPLIISARFKPEVVLITRHAIGGFKNIENHQDISFNTLEQGYSESGFEINKLIFGFGLSFAYRYGAYHLPEMEDNISVKFTFNLQL